MRRCHSFFHLGIFKCDLSVDLVCLILFIAQGTSPHWLRNKRPVCGSSCRVFKAPSADLNSNALILQVIVRITTQLVLLSASWADIAVTVDDVSGLTSCLLEWRKARSVAARANLLSIAND